MRIEIITAITGGKDSLREDQPKSGAKYIAYVDGIDLPVSNTWEIRKAFDKFKDARRNSRVHKIMVHKYSDADVTIWIDGNIKLLLPPEEIVAKYLREDDDMVQFIHGARDCIYDEAIVCAKLGLDDPELIIEQAKYYEDSGYGKNKGLNSGYFIIRRNNRRTRDMNESWWADYCRFSRRDQISLMPAIDRAGIQINRIHEGWRVHESGQTVMGGVAAIQNHRHYEGNFNDPKNV